MPCRNIAASPRPSRPSSRCPRQHVRQDGWTPERQKDFIDALADTGSVRQAAARVGMASEGAYMLRRAACAESFNAAWLAALDHGIKQLEDVALDRAINGVEQPVYSYGKLIGTRTVYNDRLIMFMLRNRATDRFGPTTPHVSAKERQRIFEEVRLQFEEENKPDMERTRASIKRKIEAIVKMEERREARLGIIRVHLKGEDARDYECWQAARAEGRVVILPGAGEDAAQERPALPGPAIRRLDGD